MKNLSTGTGLALLAGAALAYPFVSSFAPNANASAVTAAAAVTTAATGQTTPTIVWMGVTGMDADGFHRNFFRLWSDGRMEGRSIHFAWTWNGSCLDVSFQSPCGDTGWVEIPAPAGGNGFACRADIDGNRVVDGADLGTILANWGAQPPCQPEATFPCMTVGGGQFVK